MVCGYVPALRMRAVGLEGARGEGGFRARALPPARAGRGPRGAEGEDQLELEHPATSVRGAEPIPSSGRREGSVLCCWEVAFGRKEASSPHLLRGSSSETLQGTLESPTKAKAGPFV